MKSVVLKTKIPEHIKALPQIPSRIYRKYRPEYFNVEPLLEISSRVYDAIPDPHFWTSTPEEIAEIILQDTQHPEYREAFIKNQIDGKAVIFLEADKFPRISIKQFEVIKELTAKIRKLCKTDQDEFKRSISLPIRRPQVLYMWFKAKRTGPTAFYMTPSKYFKLIHILHEPLTGGLKYYTLLNHWNRIPPFIPQYPHAMVGASRRINLMTGTTQRQNFKPKDHPYLLKDLCFYHLPHDYLNMKPYSS